MSGRELDTLGNSEEDWALADLIRAQLSALALPSPTRTFVIDGDEDVALLVMSYGNGSEALLLYRAARQLAELTGIHLGREVAAYDFKRTADGTRVVMLVYLGSPTADEVERATALANWRGQMLRAARGHRQGLALRRAEARRLRAQSRAAVVSARSARVRRRMAAARRAREAPGPTMPISLGDLVQIDATPTRLQSVSGSASEDVSGSSSWRYR